MQIDLFIYVIHFYYRNSVNLLLKTLISKGGGGGGCAWPLTANILIVMILFYAFASNS